MPASEVSGCCDFSHPRHELYAGCASEQQRRRTRGRGKKRRERKGRRTGHTGEKAGVGRGVGHRARFLKRGNKEACGWRQEKDADEQAEIMEAAHSCTDSK